MRLPNLHTAPKRHFIKFRIFLLQKPKAVRRFKGLTLAQIFSNLAQIYNTLQSL